MVDIVLNNKINEFKDQLDQECNFDYVLGEFYKSHINVDTILEKIHKRGINSLNENDLHVLKTRI